MTAVSNTHYQSTFAVQPIGTVGEVADNTGLEKYANRINGEGSSVGFGRAVMRDGSSAANFKAVAGTTPDIMGVTIVSTAQTAIDSDDRTYADGYQARLLYDGTVWMEAAGTLAAGDIPYIGTSGVDQGKPGPASTGGTYPQTSLTLSGALDDGQGRVQTMTWSGNFVNLNVINMTIGGEAIPAVTFDTDQGTTAGMLKTALEIALAASNQQALVSITDPGTDLVFTITSLDQPWSATAQAITGVVVTLGLGQVTETIADQQAGAAPHSLSITVGATPVSTVWSGSSDDTMHNFAEELAGVAAASGAVVTEVPNGDDLTIVLTGATKAADIIDLAAATVTGGDNARTMSVDNELVPGVAATAVQWTQARALTAATDGNLVKIAVAVTPQP